MRNRMMPIWSRAKSQPLMVGVVIFLLVIVLLGCNRLWNEYQLARHTLAVAVMRVHTIAAKSTPKMARIVLPGNVSAWHEADLYARANGYLRVWNVDIGYHVKKGDVLAVIERPELDAEYREASDYLNVVNAQNELAQITAKRWGNLVKTDSVSKQSNDNKNYEAQALSASLSKARANVDKLSAYVSFEEVKAPFDGTISLRLTDFGDLINVGSNPAQATPLFHIVQSNPLRLYVNIPQTYVTQITPNLKTTLTFSEHPGKLFHARLLKTAEAINPRTLTLQAEFEVENNDYLLLPGSYASVEFSVPSVKNSIILPVNTLIFQAGGLQVAVVDGGHVVLKNISVGTDFGNQVQINSGIAAGAQVVLNPMDTLYQGQAVRVIHDEKSIV